MSALKQEGYGILTDAFSARVLPDESLEVLQELKFDIDSVQSILGVMKKFIQSNRIDLYEDLFNKMVSLNAEFSHGFRGGTADLITHLRTTIPKTYGEDEGSQIIKYLASIYTVDDEFNSNIWTRKIPR